MDAMEQLLSQGYTHYQCEYYSMWNDETWRGSVYPIEPLKTTAGHFSDNFEDSGDIAEVHLFKGI